jgi:hypothetical protein
MRPGRVYLAEMDLVFILVIAFLVLPLIGLVRLAWGVWGPRNEEMESGGSDGRQIFTRK